MLQFIPQFCKNFRTELTEVLYRRALRTDNMRIFVLDEADEMLSRGFKDQIYDVFKFLPSKVQVGHPIEQLVKTGF